ncbi:DUF1566 domain-containing protein [Roseibium sp. RKSG952]|uniref:Lcl C-terminal domain-containing protein n=1 Tax=Roseibium sp. RKSG952 TaxID=2529384 RepID=UPI0012BC74C2|nr:DUF1566 domain-containing protein [Roseibium sp. RKSG952]MTH97852.1 DUF1566 domain-containing protein [Roseibium sp. RKSG952]
MRPALFVLACLSSTTALAAPAFPVVGTGQVECFSDSIGIPCPESGQPFHGQDAQHPAHEPHYVDNSDGTVTDTNTNLMWQKSPDTNGDGVVNAADKMTYEQAVEATKKFELAGKTDWRLPTIKELYSLITFNGTDSFGPQNADGAVILPFIDARYFDYAPGDEKAGERYIDSQFATSTLYEPGTGPFKDKTMFGVNFADGRIKGYGLQMPGGRGEKTFYVLLVRGNEGYGVNDFKDNGDGTVTDRTSGLMWSKADNGEGVDWNQALAFVQERNAENYLGYDDWRLPNAKELQNIVDYDRSPDMTGSAAIDPVFATTQVTK